MEEENEVARYLQSLRSALGALVQSRRHMKDRYGGEMSLLEYSDAKEDLSDARMALSALEGIVAEEYGSVDELKRALRAIAAREQLDELMKHL